MSELIRLIGILISLVSMVEASESMIEPEPIPIAIPYRSPCEEDEGWITVDHRDPLSTLDGSVSRRCINLDEIAHYLSHHADDYANQQEREDR